MSSKSAKGEAGLHFSRIPGLQQSESRLGIRDLDWTFAMSTEHSESRLGTQNLDWTFGISAGNADLGRTFEISARRSKSIWVAKVECARIHVKKNTEFRDAYMYFFTSAALVGSLGMDIFEMNLFQKYMKTL